MDKSNTPLPTVAVPRGPYAPEGLEHAVRALSTPEVEELCEVVLYPSDAAKRPETDGVIALPDAASAGFPASIDALRQHLVAFGAKGEAPLVLSNRLMRIVFPTAPTFQEAVTTAHNIVCRDYLCVAPRIAVVGPALPPAEGEDAPRHPLVEAIETLTTQGGMRVCGPYDQATFYEHQYFKAFDIIVALDPDDAYRQFTAYRGDDAVATLAAPDVLVAAPFVTADDSGETLVHALYHSLYHIIDTSRNRLTYDESHANPLPHVVQHDRREERHPRREE